MTVTAVPRFSWSPLVLDPITLAHPYSTTDWMANYTLPNVPDKVVGFLIAQGWVVDSVRQDDSTRPPTSYYTLKRKAMQNDVILTQLIQEYCSAYNEALKKNDWRYDELVSLWCVTATTSEDHLDAMGTNANAFFNVYVTSYLALLDAVDATITAATNEAVATTVACAATMATFQTKLADLATNYAAHLAKIDALLLTEGTALTTFLSDYDIELAKLETTYNAHLAAINARISTLSSQTTSHISTYQGQLNALSTNYTTHHTVAEALLVDLGVAELARIGEQFDNAKAAAHQSLVTRGFYSSALVTSVDARIERERSEAITALNDRLAREKLENEHRLYEQQVAMRLRTMDGLDRIYAVRDTLTKIQIDLGFKLESEIENIRLKLAEGIDRQHALTQEVTRNESNQRDKLYEQIQTSLVQLLDGYKTYTDAGLRTGQFALDVRSRMIALELDVVAKRMAAVEGQHHRELELQKYQIDTRNGLLTALFKFMEAREDIGPDLDEIGKLTMSLGDAGGQWLSPQR
jgi:hypothetical protein